MVPLLGAVLDPQRAGADVDERVRARDQIALERQDVGGVAAHAERALQAQPLDTRAAFDLDQHIDLDHGLLLLRPLLRRRLLVGLHRLDVAGVIVVLVERILDDVVLARAPPT